MRLHQLDVDLGPRVRAAFTGRSADADLASGGVGLAGNVATSQPHSPSELAAARSGVAASVGLASDDLVWLQQVHGTRVVVVDASTPANALAGPGDAMLTGRERCGLAVLVADCVPVLVAGQTPAGTDVVGVAHAGRRGVVADVVGALVSAMVAQRAGRLQAAIGPAIRGCCYEVEAWLRDEVVALHPAANAVTTWGTPALDLPAAVAERLTSLDVEVRDVDVCTACDDRWFSHRVAARRAGRQAGVIAIASRDAASAVAP